MNNLTGNEISENAEENFLAELGYKQSLHRGIGSFGSFAAGVSYISILTGTFQLFYLGYHNVGPAYLWGWPMVFIGQLLVALCFMELVSFYPVAGSVYNWTKLLGNKTLGWCGGWLMLMASIISIASVVLSLESNLPQLWSGFEFIGNHKNPTPSAMAKNSLLLGIIAIVFTTIINCSPVKIMNLVTSVGVVIELVAAISLAVILMFLMHNSPAIFVHTDGFVGPGKFIPAFLIGSIASGYVMYGFDTASSLAEETVDPRKIAPHAISRALIASFIIGGTMLFFAILAAPNVYDSRLWNVDGLQYLMKTVLGSSLSFPIFICTTTAVLVCALTIHTAAIRLVFAMSRDKNLPASQFLSQSLRRYGTPVCAAVTIGILAAGFLLINIGQPHIFSTVSSIAVIMIYLSYLLVTSSLLIRRCQGKWPIATGGGYFSLGKYGFIINLLAVFWGLCMTINIAWPRAEVYGTGWINTWSGCLYPMAIMLLGLIWYVLRGRKTGSSFENALREVGL